MFADLVIDVVLGYSGILVRLCDDLSHSIS